MTVFFVEGELFALFKSYNLDALGLLGHIKTFSASLQKNHFNFRLKENRTLSLKKLSSVLEIFVEEKEKQTFILFKKHHLLLSFRTVLTLVYKTSPTARLSVKKLFC